MATRMTKAQKLAAQEALRDEALQPFADKLGKLGGEWVKVERRSTQLKVQLGSLGISMLTALVDKSYPEADRPDAIVSAMANVGVKGFSFKTIEGWGKASHSYGVLPKEIRDEFPIASLVDLARVPTSPEDKTGGRVAVAVASLAAGNKTDDEHRKFIREARRAASGWKKPEAPSLLDMATAIGKKAGSKPPVLTPNPDGVFELTHDQLVSAVEWGVAIRGTGGDKDARAYRMVIRSAFPESAPVADTDDTPTVELTDDEARELQLAD